jgi:adhesin transport system outer membrane protein
VFVGLIVNARTVGRSASALVALLSLAACMEQPTRMATGAPLTGDVGTEQVMVGSAARSRLILDLQSRNSVLPAGGPFSRIAEDVLAASKGAAAAELRVAQLRAEAKSKNWLPQIGPSVSLTSLSGLVAGLALTQPLLDNGRRKAERDFAAADVEVAAVGLSQAMNQRVYEGLTHYIHAQRAHAQAAVSRRSADRLAKFDTLMQARVEGGLSDMSEQNVISQRYFEVQAQVSSDARAAQTAEAQLAALTGNEPTDMRGIDTIRDMKEGPPALTVLRKQGEGARVLAQVQLQRAEMLPGLAASADVTETSTNTGLRLTGLGILNPGAGDTMQALEETKTVVARQNAEMADTAQRRLVALTGEIATLNTRAAQGAKVLAQTEAIWNCFPNSTSWGAAACWNWSANTMLLRRWNGIKPPFDLKLRFAALKSPAIWACSWMENGYEWFFQPAQIQTGCQPANRIGTIAPRRCASGCRAGTSGAPDGRGATAREYPNQCCRGKCRLGRGRANAPCRAAAACTECCARRCGKGQPVPWLDRARTLGW